MATSSPSSSSADVVNSPGSVLSYKNLSYSVKTKAGQKQLVDDVSVDIRAGELLAIMVRLSIHIPHSSLIVIPGTIWSGFVDHQSDYSFSLLMCANSRKEHIAGSHVIQEDADARRIGQYPSG